MQKIIQGVRKFQHEILPQKRALFEKLAEGQSPSALVISCADSRVDMQLVTQSDPGELFCFRNAGNIVPPYGAMLGAISATIEYAMVVLKVPNIIVCGHTDCGAMKALLRPESIAAMPTVRAWLRHSDVARQMVLGVDRDRPEAEILDALIKENVLAQIDHLRTHPSVAVALARGELNLHAWVYDIKTGDVQAYDAVRAEFTSLLAPEMPHATPVSRFPAARPVIGGRR